MSLERLRCGTVEHDTVRPEARAVARAVPALLHIVPLHHASQVRACGGELVEATVVVAIDRKQPETVADYRTRAHRDIVARLDVAASDAILHEMTQYVG